MKQSTPIRRILAWLAFVGAGLALAWISGRLEVRLVPDSPSYQNFSFRSLEAICREIRTPMYPLWLSALTSTIGLAFVPAAQVIVHATASWAFFSELRRWDLSDKTALAAAIAVGIGCTPMNEINVVATDALAASVGVLVVVYLLRWARTRGHFASALAIMLCSCLAIFLRPAYLFLIPWLGVCGTLLVRSREDSWSLAARRAVVLSVLPLIPVLAWMAVRYVSVGEFAIVPFGHQNLAGITVQLVSDDELTTLGELGDEVVRRRNTYFQQSFDQPNSETTTHLNERWHEMVYEVIYPAIHATVGTDPIDGHRQVSELNVAIVRGWPHRYLIWLLRGFRLGMWTVAANLTMHPVFLVGLIVMAWLVVARAAAGGTVGGPPRDAGADAVSAVAIIAISYAIAKVGFVVLSSPPIGRFSDAAAIFLPAWMAAAFIRWYHNPA